MDEALKNLINHSEISFDELLASLIRIRKEYSKESSEYIIDPQYDPHLMTLLDHCSLVVNVNIELF